MNLDWVEDLEALSEAGSFAVAAGRRGRSTSAFSRRIRALEQWAGAELVDRSTQPVRLTPAGRTFLGEAAGVGALLASARRTFASTASPRS